MLTGKFIRWESFRRASVKPLRSLCNLIFSCSSIIQIQEGPILRKLVPNWSLFIPEKSRPIFVGPDLATLQSTKSCFIKGDGEYSSVIRYFSEIWKNRAKISSFSNKSWKKTCIFLPFSSVFTHLRIESVKILLLCFLHTK